MTCELKSQPALETREEWSFRRKQQHWDPDSQVKFPFTVRQTNVSRSHSRMHDRPRVTRVPSVYELTFFC